MVGGPGQEKHMTNFTGIVTTLMQKLSPICKIIAHPPGKEGCGRIPGEKAYQTPPHPDTREGEVSTIAKGEV